LGKLQSLQELNLDKNHLTSLPKELRDIIDIKKVLNTQQ